jgi:hypothetical protein
MSILCAIPLIALLFACSEAPKVSYETIKLQRPTTIDCERRGIQQRQGDRAANPGR